MSNEKKVRVVVCLIALVACLASEAMPKSVDGRERTPGAGVAVTDVNRSDAGHAATVTWRVHQPLWEDDAAFAETLAFFVRNRLTGKVALFAGDFHLPQSLGRIRGYQPVLARRLAAFKALGYEAGINYLCTLGHRTENLRDAAVVPGAVPFTDDAGREAQCHCPNDPVWREKYLAEVYTLLAKAGPDFIWTDDDIRLSRHAPAYGFGCFCDGCLRRVRARLGFTGERRDLAAFFADPEKGDSRRRAMLQLNRETLGGLFDFIRRTVWGVDPKIALGVMDSTNDWNAEPFDEIVRAFAPAGKERILWRPGGSFYSESRPDDLVWSANGIGGHALRLPDGVAAVESEIECFHYQRLAMSDAMLRTEALTLLAVGTRGTAWNVLPNVVPNMEDLAVFDRRVRRLEALRPIADAYVLAADGARPRGVWNGRGRDIRIGANPKGDWFASGGEDGEFLGSELQKIGIPAAYREEDADVIAPSAQAVWAATPERLEAWLSRGLFLTVPALMAFIDRGYGADVGFVPGETRDIDVYERSVGHPLNGGEIGRMRDARQSFWGGTATFLKPLAGARTMSEAVDIKGRPFAPCLSGTFENRFGGRVYATGYFPYRYQMFSPCCARMKRVFNWLSKDTLKGWVASYHRAAFWVRGDRTAVFLNLSLGGAEEVEIVLRGEVWSKGIRLVGEKDAPAIQGTRERDLTRYRLPSVPGFAVRVYAPAG